MPGVHDFTADAIDGRQTRLLDYAGQVLLIVNTASRCGFTPQYAGLEQLHRELNPRGFSVLGFPCNQFGHQEPGSNAEIATFCTDRFAVSFPLFARVDVNGANAHPLYDHLKRARRGLFGSGAIKWNFTKFLIDRAGRVIDRFGPAVTPARLRPRVEAALSDQALRP